MEEMAFLVSIVLLLVTIVFYALRGRLRRFLMRTPPEHRIMVVIWRWIVLPDLPFLIAAAAYVVVSAAAGGDQGAIRIVVIFAATVSLIGDAVVALVGFAASKAEDQRKRNAAHAQEIDDGG